MAKIKWLPEALADIDRLYRFLQDNDAQAASRVAATIIGGSSQLQSFPRLGRPMDDDTARRELFIAFGGGAYVLRYKLEGDQTAIIVLVWHSREYR